MPWERPEVIPAAVAVAAFLAWKRQLLKRSGVKQYLCVHRQPKAPQAAMAAP